MQPLDWLVIAAYAGLLLFLGWRASRGQKSAESHLRADRSLPAWAVIFSVLATEISAATYIGVPEKGYNDTWRYLQLAVGSLLGKIVLGTLVLRLYWRLNLPTVYGFLRQRIGPSAQRFSAWAFLAGRLIASGVRLYIAALAFSVVTGFSLPGGIAFMAALSTLYTLTGGLRAVVWTDVAQGAIFVIGAGAALVFGLHLLPISPLDALREAWGQGKLEIFVWSARDGESWLVSDRPLPMALVAGFFLTLATHGTDQENVQHLLNTKSERSSWLSIVGSGLFTFPIVALFLAVGTMLWAYHAHVNVAAYDPADTKRIFPNFIMHALPMGLRGLVFAGLFAAAVSSLGATLNATAAIWTTDIRPWAGAAASGLARVRRLNAVFGGLLMLVALFFAWYAGESQTDLVDIALSAMTILYGGILGGFLCALFLPGRGSDGSVTTGMVAGCVLGALLFFQVDVVRVLGLAQPFGFSPQEKLLGWHWSLPVCAMVTMLIASTRRRPAPPSTHA